MTEMNDSNNLNKKSNDQIESQEELREKPVTKRSTGQKVLGFLINFLVIIIIGIAVILVWDRLQSRSGVSMKEIAVDTPAREEVPSIDEPESAAKVNLAPYVTSVPFDGDAGVSRSIEIHTTIPTRPRVDVITYTVQAGDSVFSIAELHGLKPETILWGNYDVLKDDPHLLKEGQVLSILPVNGTYYEWTEGDQLSQVAAFFEVEPQAIMEYPGNRFDLTIASADDVEIEPGTRLIVPGGQREVQDWGPPQITRDNPASAAYYGAGSCGSVYSGAIGNGTFVWPTTERYLSGYTYNPPVHRGIDIAGDTGNAIFATDAGVVVYSGWSNYGYGYLIVLDHGNGWQSAYAHLSSIAVGCGQSVFQGTVIGGLGNTGNSSGSHLHFELVNGGAKLNPLNFLQ